MGTCAIVALLASGQECPLYTLGISAISIATFRSASLFRQRLFSANTELYLSG